MTELPEETEILSEEALDAALEETEGQKTVDEESGLTLGEVLLQAEDQGIDIQGLENGESVSFTAQVPAARAARASQSVTITQGSYYYYADYGLGSYVTAPFTRVFWECDSYGLLYSAVKTRAGKRNLPDHKTGRKPGTGKGVLLRDRSLWISLFL